MAMQTTPSNGIYETSDIALAAYLFSSGTTLLEIDRSNPRRAAFVFESPKPELLAEWQRGQATVNALAYHNAYQELKARIFRGGEG